MSLVDLSLDEIIARRKEADNKSNGFNKRFSNSKKKKDFVPEYSSTKSGFTRPEDVPSGKWDHSGFEEMYGSESGNDRSPVPAIGRHGKINRVDLARKIRLHITNLAPTVNSADLSELFEEYAIESANVNYDEMGQSVGTADVVTDRLTAKEIVANLNGVALDGEVMSFHMIDEKTVLANRNVHVKNRLSFQDRSWSAFKNRPLKRLAKGPKSRKIRTKRSQMTDEELDRELEEYMNKRNQKQVDQKMEI